MRKQLLGLLVPLLTLTLSAAAADMTGKGVASTAALQRLEVTHSHDGLSVEFRAKGTLAPKVTTLDSPARIVVDFPNTVMATAQSLISIGQDGVKEVRIGMDGQVPPHTHVVIDLTNDLADSRPHQMVANPDGSFILTIHGTVMARRQNDTADAGVKRHAATGQRVGSGCRRRLHLKIPQGSRPMWPSSSPHTL